MIAFHKITLLEKIDLRSTRINKLWRFTDRRLIVKIPISFTSIQTERKNPRYDINWISTRGFALKFNKRTRRGEIARQISSLIPWKTQYYYAILSWRVKIWTEETGKQGTSSKFLRAKFTGQIQFQKPGWISFNRENHLLGGINTND